jgi:hypothetical protein
MKKTLLLIAAALFLLAPLAAQSITVTSPNGGEKMTLGQLLPFPISWSAQGVKQNVKISLLRANGSEFGLIEDNLLACSSPYPWTVGQIENGKVPAGKYKIRVAAMDGSSGDVSNAVFTIAAWQPPGELPGEPSLNLLSPNGDEVWGFETWKNITWKVQYWTGKVRLVLLQDGQNMGGIASGLPSSQASFSWKAGQTDKGSFKGSGFKVRIAREYPGDIVPLNPLMDESHKSFTIMQDKPVLRIISPNGGETLALGSMRNITWISKGWSGKVRLFLWWGDERYGEITENILPVADGHFEWIVGRTVNGSAPPGQYQISIEGQMPNSDLTDKSDNSFSIISTF